MRRTIAIACYIVATTGSASAADELLLNGTWQLNPETMELRLSRGAHREASVAPAP